MKTGWLHILPGQRRGSTGSVTLYNIFMTVRASWVTFRAAFFMRRGTLGQIGLSLGESTGMEPSVFD